MKGKTIQIYLPDGNPRSIKIAEITSRTVQVVLIPRAKLEEAAGRNELAAVGVYYLVAAQEDEGKQPLYIGEAEDCLSRLKQHNKNKDFWTHALVVLSRTGFFTKSHVKYLEHHSYLEAQKSVSFSLENTNIPSRPHVSEPVEADLLDNFETIRILTSTLGYPFFEIEKKTSAKEILHCKGKDAEAKGEYSEEGLRVFAGSTCNLEETKSAGNWIVNKRRKLVDSGILVEDDPVLRFTQNYPFASPSAAAAVVLGRQTNGWLQWKYKDGRTLDEVKRK